MLQFEAFVVFAVQEVWFFFIEKLPIYILCLRVLVQLEINRRETLACFQRRLFASHSDIFLVECYSFLPIFTTPPVRLGCRVYQSSSKAVACINDILMIGSILWFRL
jgi:hypothetical protein